MNLAFDEVVDFLAAGPSSRQLADFQASSETRRRVEFLIHKEKTEGLLPEEKTELDDFMQLEHLMRLTKARARHRISAGE